MNDIHYKSYVSSSVLSLHLSYFSLTPIPMASQPRPPWFRFSLGNRAPAPAPVPAPAPAPPPPLLRPSFQIRPTLNQQPPPPPPQQPAPPPPKSPSPPPSPAPTMQPPSPRAPSVAAAAAAPPTPPAPAAAPSVATPIPAAAPPPVTVAAPAAPPPRPSPIAPIRPSVAPPIPARPLTAPPIRPFVTPAAPPSPPPATASPLQKSPVRTPPPSTKSPQKINSPLKKETFTTSTMNAPPPPPETKPPPPPSPPSPKPVSASQVVNAKAPTPIASPKIIKPFERSPAESPKTTKPLSRHPSPLTLPPAQANSDDDRDQKKTVVEDKTVDKTVRMARARNNGTPSDGKREPLQNTLKEKGTSKKSVSDSEDQMSLRMITLAGENKGAVMELKPSHKKNHSAAAGRPQSLQQGSSEIKGEEGKSRNKEKANGAATVQSPMAGYFNSNVQGMNNSIIYNANVRHNDPGIHLSLATKGGSHKE